MPYLMCEDPHDPILIEGITIDDLEDCVMALGNFHGAVPLDIIGLDRKTDKYIMRRLCRLGLVDRDRAGHFRLSRSGNRFAEEISRLTAEELMSGRTIQEIQIEEESSFAVIPNQFARDEHRSLQ